MKLLNHAKNIVTIDDWYNVCPPKKGEKQWVDGRSAKELAKYILNAMPSVPNEIEKALSKIVPANTEFNWDAEYVTALPGIGEGRNHDAVLFGPDIVVTIEAKADEPLGNLIGDEIKNASVNKLYRITKLLQYIFKDGAKNYHSLRYQLLTASAGTILEAENKGFKCAVLIVLTFKNNGNVTEAKMNVNRSDIDAFLKATEAYEENGLYVIPNNTDTKLYFKEIII